MAILVILCTSFLYYVHLSTLTLRKIGRRKEDGSSGHYEARMKAATIVNTFVLMFWMLLPVEIIDILFNIRRVETHRLKEKWIIRSEKGFENSFLSEEQLYLKKSWSPEFRYSEEKLSFYLGREDAWNRKCRQQGLGYYCRLASRPAYVKGQTQKEKTLLEKACNQGDLLGCYRLFSLTTGFEDNKRLRLIEACLNPQNKQNAYCGLLGKTLYERGDVENALLVYEHTCIKHRQHCIDFVRTFAADKYTSNHKKACREGVKSSCDALILVRASRDTASVLSKKNALIKAVTFGANDITEQLITKGADIQSEDDSGNTPLHLAVKSGNISLVDLLLSKGAKVNAVNKYGETPLIMTANKYKCSKNSKTIFEKLLNQEAEINMVSNDDQTALTLSSRRKDTHIFKELLSRDAQLYLNKSPAFLLTIIHSGHPNNIKELFNRIDSKKIFDKVNPFKLIKYAVKYSSKEKIDLLFEEVKKNSIDLKALNDVILREAYLRDDREIIKMLRENGFVSPRSFLTALKISYLRYANFRNGNG